MDLGKKLNFLGFLLAVSVICVPALAQTVTGSITGTVTDQTGGVIPGATVTLENIETHEPRSLETGPNGVFTFIAIPPGRYTLVVKASGFAGHETKGLVLSAAERLSLGRIQLTLGPITDTVSVTAAGGTVQTTSSEVSALLTTEQLGKTMQLGRDMIGLLRTMPGVNYGVDSESPGGAIGSSIPSIQGGRMTSTNVTVDGVTGKDVHGATSATTVVNLDAISEVKVLLNSYQAEYGRTAGSFVSVVTKGGTRDFHGGGYWYKRHESLNANSFINNRTRVAKPIYRYNTFGGTLGGPIYIPNRFNRDRSNLFFFYSAEIWRVWLPQALQRTTMPTALERAGDFSKSLDLSGKVMTIIDPRTREAFQGNVIPPDRINKQGKVILNQFPLPNLDNRSLTGGTYNNVFQESQENPKTNHMLRLDLNPTNKDRISVRGNWWRQTFLGYGVTFGMGGQWDRFKHAFQSGDKSIMLNYARTINPTMVNEFTASARVRQEKAPLQRTLDPIRRSSVGFTAGQLYPQANLLEIVPGASFGGVTGAASQTAPWWFPLYNYALDLVLSNNLTWVRRNHMIKFGIYADRARVHDGPMGYTTGSFDFGRDPTNPVDAGHPYANALLGNFRSYTEASAPGNQKNTIRAVDLFAQDSWKVIPTFTLEYGLRVGWYTQWDQYDGKAAAWALERYDPAKAPKFIVPKLDPQGNRVGYNPVTGQLVAAAQIGSFVAGSGNIVNGMVLADDRSYPKGFMESVGLLWAPRFGFAYDIGGRGKTAIRGGFGIFHDGRPPGGIMWYLALNPPIQYNPIIYNGNLDTFRTGGELFFPSSVDTWEKNPHKTSAYNYNLSIQQAIGFDTVVNIAYAGSLSRHLIQARNINLVPYGARFLPQNADPAAPQRPLADIFFSPYPGYGSIIYNENAGSGNYHALQFSANKRLAKGVQYGISYTWSKAMSNTSQDSHHSRNMVATYRPQRIWTYGKTTFDQTHDLVINYIWELPKVSKLWDTRLIHAALDGWQLSGITAFVSGTPSGISFTTTDAADITGGGDGARVVVTGNPILSKGARSFNRWFNTDAFARPNKGDFGNAPKDVFRLPGVNNWDVTLTKTIRLHEALSLQARWEMYNVFNHTQWSGVDTTARFDTAGKQVNTRFGEVTAVRSPRRMQGSLRIIF